MEPVMPGRVDQRAVANDMRLIILADHRGRRWAHPVVSTRFNTYISSISLHAAHEDRLGRLSMWRAFGGQNTLRVAFVFSIPNQTKIARMLDRLELCSSRSPSWTVSVMQCLRMAHPTRRAK